MKRKKQVVKQEIRFKFSKENFSQDISASVYDVAIAHAALEYEMIMLLATLDDKERQELESKLDIIKHATYKTLKGKEANEKH